MWGKFTFYHTVELLKPILFVPRHSFGCGVRLGQLSLLGEQGDLNTSVAPWTKLNLKYGWFTMALDLSSCLRKTGLLPLLLSLSHATSIFVKGIKMFILSYCSRLACGLKIRTQCLCDFSPEQFQTLQKLFFSCSQLSENIQIFSTLHPQGCFPCFVKKVCKTEQESEEANVTHQPPGQILDLSLYPLVSQTHIPLPFCNYSGDI